MCYRFQVLTCALSVAGNEPSLLLSYVSWTYLEVYYGVPSRLSVCD